MLGYMAPVYQKTSEDRGTYLQAFCATSSVVRLLLATSW